MLLATVRTDIAEYLSVLIYVYILLIFVHIILRMLFMFGVRPPYSRASNAVLDFLRDICEPFLRLFRSMAPQLGGLDLSPTLAILTLYIVNILIVQDLIHG